MESSSFEWQQSLVATPIFESATSSELSAIFNSLDADPYVGVVPRGRGLRDSASLGFCDASCNANAQMPDMNPVLLYITDLLMAEEIGAQQSTSQQRDDGPPADLLKEMEDILSSTGDFCDDIFSNISSIEGPVGSLVPRISDGSSSCEKNEMEGSINEIFGFASLTEDQCFLSGPGRSSEISLATPENGLSELNLWHDSSLQSLEDILDKAINDSVSDFGEGLPELGDDLLQDCLEKNTEELAEKLSESAPACGEDRSGGARTETGEAGVACGEDRCGGTGSETVETGRDVEQVAASGGPMQEAEELARRKAGGGGVTEKMSGVTGTAQILTVEERGPAAAQKKSGGSRRRRRGGPRLRVAEPSVVDLRALLVNCAQAVSALDTSLARKILHDISRTASPLGNGLQRLAYYFAEGLAARLVGRVTAGGSASFLAGGSASSIADNQLEAERVLRAYHTFVAVCPFLKLSHFAANDAILNAARGAHRLHIIDFNTLYGFQWPCFIQALAERAGGPPVLRFTVIDIPSSATVQLESPATTAFRLTETGRRLAGYARLYGVPFEYQIWERHWQDISAASLRLQPGEVVVVNCIHRLRHVMDETMVAPPANPRKALLTLLRRLNPRLFVEGIVNATYNVPFFLSRFREALFHYSSVFDALDATIRSDLEERMVIERVIMGREILNVVACEGVDRLERPETYRQWQLRTQGVGFEMLPLDPLVKSKAQALAHNFYHKDYGVEDDEQGHWLLLGWKGRILHGISTWRPSSQ